MRVRPLPLVAAVFGAAALAAAFVVRQLPHERDARPSPAADAPAPRAQEPAAPRGLLVGTVTLPDGRPAAGARVWAAARDHAAEATSDASGRFALALPAGRFSVLASHGERAVAAPSPVAVAPGAEPAPLELRLGPGAVLEGEVVLSATGAPAVGASVAVRLHETGGVVARAETDAAGRFALAALPGGAFDVRASARAASPAVAPGVTLRAGERFPLRLALERTGAAEGAVGDEAGRPLAGVRVRAVPRDPVDGAALETRSGFDGSWRIDGLAAGAVDVVALQEGVAVGAARALRIAPGATSRVNLLLPRAGVLAGRVGREGKPVAGATVVARPLEASLGGGQVARADADDAGRYELALPGGEYRIHAAPPRAAEADGREEPRFARVAPGGAAWLDLALGSGAAADLVELLVLEPDGAPSPGAAVTLSRPGAGTVALATSADEGGRVSLASEGLAGRAVVVRARNGGRAGTVAVELPPSGTVTVRLAAAGAVRGVVRGAGPAPAALTVEVASQPAPGSWRTVDVHRFAGDRFELGDLPAEPLRLLVRAEDGRRGAAEVRPAAGDVRTVEIALER